MNFIIEEHRDEDADPLRRGNGAMKVDWKFHGVGPQYDLQDVVGQVDEQAL